MPARSGGLLLFRRSPALQVLLGHMGGPLWARKHEGAWSAPKGLLERGESFEDAARREFAEELGVPVPTGPLLPLGEARQPSGKLVVLWALEGDLDPALIVPGTFEMEWPPRSGVRRSFPELDRAAWFSVEEARSLITAGQRVFLDRLVAALAAETVGPG